MTFVYTLASYQYISNIHQTEVYSDTRIRQNMDILAAYFPDSQEILLQINKAMAERAMCATEITRGMGDLQKILQINVVNVHNYSSDTRYSVTNVTSAIRLLFFSLTSIRQSSAWNIPSI